MIFKVGNIFRIPKHRIKLLYITDFRITVGKIELFHFILQLGVKIIIQNLLHYRKTQFKAVN